MHLDTPGRCQSRERVRVQVCEYSQRERRSQELQAASSIRDRGLCVEKMHMHALGELSVWEGLGIAADSARRSLSVPYARTPRIHNN